MPDVYQYLHLTHLTLLNQHMILHQIDHRLVEIIL